MTLRRLGQFFKRSVSRESRHELTPVRPEANQPDWVVAFRQELYQEAKESLISHLFEPERDWNQINRERMNIRVVYPDFVKKDPYWRK